MRAASTETIVIYTYLAFDAMRASSHLYQRNYSPVADNDDAACAAAAAAAAVNLLNRGFILFHSPLAERIFPAMCVNECELSLVAPFLVDLCEASRYFTRFS